MARSALVEVEFDQRAFTARSIPDRVRVSKSYRDEVAWKCPVGSAEIQFKGEKGSPFQTDYFVVPEGGSVGSGPVREDALLGIYPYSIVGRLGKRRNPFVGDPEVDVQL